MSRLKLLVLFVAISAIAIACSGGSDEPSIIATFGPTSTAGPDAESGLATAEPVRTPDQPTATSQLSQPDPTATTPAVIEIIQPPALPTTLTTFRVRLPDNTPADHPPHIRLMPFSDLSWNEHLPLRDVGGGVWEATADLPVGGIIRYLYDIWDEEDFLSIQTSREAFAEGRFIENRLLLVDPSHPINTDVVAIWTDLPAVVDGAPLIGTVVDADTGEAVVDANVSAGGVHIATDVNGRFEFPPLPFGEQRITVHTNLGDYRAKSTSHAHSLGSEGPVITVSRAALSPVTFMANLPETTPPDAAVRLTGGVYQLGGRHYTYPGGPEDLMTPFMNRQANGTETLTVDLYEGTYVQYRYSISTVYHGLELDENNRDVFRAFVVPPSAGSPHVRNEDVNRWFNTDFVRIEIRATTPVDTPVDTPLAIDIGPTQWMQRVSDHEWVFYSHQVPNSDFGYSYVLGGSPLGFDASPGVGENGRRELVLGESDVTVNDVISTWQYQPDTSSAARGGTITINFEVAAPANTPAGSKIRLLGNRPAIGADSILSPVAGSDTIYRGSVEFGHDGALTYWFDRGVAGTESSERFSVDTNYDSQVLRSWVSSWVDVPNPSRDQVSDEYITGMYLPDLWSPDFLANSHSTFGRIASMNGGWVALSSVWSYGQIDPLPVIESRAIFASTVRTPREDIISQAAIARELGLHVFLAPQFNMEMSPGGLDALSGEKGVEWWNAWLGEAEKLWLWNAQVAEEIDAELLMLPGYVFHVFAPPGFHESEQAFMEFDQKVGELIDRVREVYSGKILMSGSVLEHTFQDKVDFIGITTFDTGHPDLPNGTPASEWAAAYDEIFVERLDPKFDRWGKPVVFYTIHLDAKFPEVVPVDTQAEMLEGIFRAIEDRPHVAGTFSWAYSMIDAPLAEGDGVRGKITEAVLAKWYSRLTE